MEENNCCSCNKKKQTGGGSEAQPLRMFDPEAPAFTLPRPYNPTNVSSMLDDNQMRSGARLLGKNCFVGSVGSVGSVSSINAITPAPSSVNVGVSGKKTQQFGGAIRYPFRWFHNDSQPFKPNFDCESRGTCPISPECACCHKSPCNCPTSCSCRYTTCKIGCPCNKGGKCGCNSKCKCKKTTCKTVGTICPCCNSAICSCAANCPCRGSTCPVLQQGGNTYMASFSQGVCPCCHQRECRCGPNCECRGKTCPRIQTGGFPTHAPLTVFTQGEPLKYNFEPDQL